MLPLARQPLALRKQIFPNPPAQRMHSDNVSPKTVLWMSRVISSVVALFLAFDGVTKVMRVPQVLDASLTLGFSPAKVVAIGIILLVCLALYLIPQTAVLGAILLTAYLGGAVATHVRVGNPLFTFTLTPVYFGILLWIALYLKHEKLRALIPLRIGAEQARQRESLHSAGQ